MTLILVFLIGITSAQKLVAQQSSNLGLPTSSQIISYLNQTIKWHHQLAIEEQLTSEPADALFVTDGKQLDLQIVRLSFDFAKTAAGLISNPSTTPQSSSHQQPSRYDSLQSAASAADTEVRQTQSEIEQLRAQLAKAPLRRRRALQNRLNALESELRLAQARSETLRALMSFVNASGTQASGGNLPTQIDELQRSVPEIASHNPNSQAAASATSPATGMASAQASHRPPPSGLLSLVTELFSLKQKMGTLDQAVASTDALSRASEQLRSSMVATLKSFTQKGEQLANQTGGKNLTQLADLQHQLDALTASFKHLSSVVLPLGEQSILLDSYKDNLARWHDTVRREYELDLKQFAIRIAVFAAVILFALALFETWRRAIFRYIHEVRRRYQFLLLRRILLWFVIGITVAFALASEIGSIATFAGLITAGLAVALQNVILAIAGYFFLIGKYGVRVGDRVQISGVTGDVIDIGLIRLHLIEIGGSGSDRHPTGRVVVFSNAVVFQPTASFYKQIPGTNFLWHEVSLTLAPDSEYLVAEQRIVKAIDSVYAKYRDHMEQQHRIMESTLNVPVPVPRPHSRLQLTQNGLEVVVRYPVEMQSAAEIDDQVTRELLHALEQPPRLRIVGSGTPTIQPAPPPKNGGEDKAA